MKPIRVSLLLWAVMLVLPSHGLAQWQFDGTPVCTPTVSQVYPVIIPDGSGGSIITWLDRRTWPSSYYDVYAQRVDAGGVPLWNASGVALCTVSARTNPFSGSAIVSDGAGGAIVAWQDYRSGAADIYAQRVSASGVPQWTANGVALCTQPNDQVVPTIVSDAAGGAIVAWTDQRSGNNDVYVQRVNNAGATLWTVNGVAVCTVALEQLVTGIVPDGTGGAIMTWQDLRGGATFDVYAQRVNPSGTVQWAANGVALCTAGNDQRFPTIVSDGAGGAIATWEDYRTGLPDIYAQRVNASGTTQWAANGVALCTVGSYQYTPKIVTDGAGGAIVTWADYYRTTPLYDVYVQRVSASGVPLWTTDGVALCTEPHYQVALAILSDGAGGAIIAWEDYRSAFFDIYAQRVSAAGVPQWTADGLAICTAPGYQQIPRIASDGTGGAIVTWEDGRDGLYRTYAQRVGKNFGEWGHPEPWIASVRDIPGDQGGKVAVNWWASNLDQHPNQTITHYSVWRAVDLAAFSARVGTGATPPLVDASAIGPEFRGSAIRHSAIRHEKVATMDYYWEWVGSQTFRYSATYSFSAPTRADSIAADPAVHCFQILAHTSDPFVFLESNVMCGYSVDNLAPAAPLSLIAQRVGADVLLRWNRVRVPDLRDYSVYRKTSSGVTPIPANFLSSANDTVLVDAGAPGALYYVVTTNDIHENQSAPSNEANVSATTNVGNTPPIATLTLLPNHPNPFTGSTELEIGLPATADVSIQVYDVAGRLVRSETLVARKSGWQPITIDSRDDHGRPLASGVYFYRVSAGGSVVTRKMVIAR